MPNRGAVLQTLNAGESYTIEEGYHNGSGRVTAKDLASQTQATAGASDIAQGKTAWVKGQKVIGVGINIKDPSTVTGDNVKVLYSWVGYSSNSSTYTFTEKIGDTIKFSVAQTASAMVYTITN